MRVLVTGANGYVGRAVVASLRTHGYEPIAMVRSESAGFDGAESVRVADLLDARSLQDAVRDVDAVCHLAGLTRARESMTEPLRYFRVNTGGTIALLEAMQAAGVQRIVFASTGSIYGTPDRQPMTEDLPPAPPHPYAASKLAAELAIESQCMGRNLAAVIIRMLNVAGGTDRDPTRLIPRALAAAVGTSVLAVNGDGSTVRDYLHITDAAEAFVAGVGRVPDLGRSDTYNIGSGSGTSVSEVIATVEKVTGQRVSVDPRPPVVEPPRLVSDVSKAASELNWKPRHSDIEAIVRDAWFSGAAGS
ncbi:NAD-dependent epimerase/dehydratase family protein [Nocardia higoensis]|uniref:UDP-glucose 4-epimerase n=1 Tax=Nocardia higoensis TaxID=228599 RepID=A0ABS0DLN7_9NOCA|nr:NAD-dependent epimerase/dehydratase family protein [Nocardia higoensis]MBF6358472.1 NAD-dependent epimerase/dehydratase family protein [Nocardia higoensis]